MVEDPVKCNVEKYRGQYAPLSNTGSDYETFGQLAAAAHMSASITLYLPAALEENLVRVYSEVPFTMRGGRQSQRPQNTCILNDGSQC